MSENRGSYYSNLRVVVGAMRTFKKNDYYAARHH